MPSISNHPATANSFLGLQSYTEAQSNFFFGRDAETDSLTSLVQLNTLTIVFGRSGTGKTSLLNAGVFPRLRKNFCLPFRIRLEFNNNSPDLVTQVKKVLKEEIDKYGFKVGSYPANETLWEYFHKEPLWKTVTPILVFDQFEEIFTLAKSNLGFAATELPYFWEELSDLIENNIPEKLKAKFLEQKNEIEYNYKTQKAKIVFSFREEYLPEFESITSRIPSLKYSRFRLLPMNGHQAYEVITKTWKENINPSEAKHLVSYFTNEQGLDDYNLITVEPSLLSQVCAYIDKERVNSGGGKVSAELLKKYPKEAILRTIYEEAVNEANHSLKGNENDNRNVIKEFVEEKLITTEGYRTKHHLGASDEILRPGINVLSAKYFVREDDNVVELTHDVVAPIIKYDREKRRTREAQAKTRKKALRIAALILILALAGGAVLALIGYLKKEEMEFLRDKADQQRKDAIVLRDQTKIELEALKKEIEQKQKELNIIINDPRFKGKKETEKTVQDLLDELNDLSKLFAELNLKTENDISNFLNSRITPDVVVPGPVIHQQNMKLNSLQDLLNKTRVQFDSLLGEFNKLKIDLDNMTKDRDYWKRMYDSLNAIEKITRKEIADSIRNVQYPPSPCPKIDTKNSLQLAIYYTKDLKYHPGVTPEQINIYLIPDNDANARVIRKAKVYDYYNFNEPALQAAKGSKSSLYCNGTYYFTNVTPGRYLIKVCTLYGAYKEIKVEKGNERIVIDAVPPIR